MSGVTVPIRKSVEESQRDTAEILTLFEPDEGYISFYYGRIRNGKTYAATADIIDLVMRGEIVYANWQIDFSEFQFDDRQKAAVVFLKMLFGRKYFFNYAPQKNFVYFHPDKVDIKQLGRLVGVHVFIDEGQWVFNSKSRTDTDDEDKRKLVLHNGHYCRSLNIISQRPSNIMKDMRSQVHVWYRCRKLISWPWIIFARERIETMKDDLPDEEEIDETKVYFADDRVKRAYSTHAMRSEDAIRPLPVCEVYQYSRWDSMRQFVSLGLPGALSHWVAPKKKPL